MKTAKVSSKYQVVIPKEIRELLRIKKNSVAAFEFKNGEVLLRNLQEFLDEHVGTVKLKKDFLEMRKEFDGEWME